MNELTNAQLERQDTVDNCIFFLLNVLAGASINESYEVDEHVLSWDMEEIGAIRDELQGIIVDKHGIMTEQEFYPYIEHEEGETNS